MAKHLFEPAVLHICADSSGFSAGAGSDPRPCESCLWSWVGYVEKEDSKIPHGRAPKDGTDVKGRERSLRLDQDLVGDSVVLTQQIAEELAGLI